MSDISIIDSTGNSLLLTTAIPYESFDAVTCSPRTDDGFGFSMLFNFVDKPYPLAMLDAACKETIAQKEVCVLPKGISSKWRVLLTPTLKSRDKGTREDAARLMKDLFYAPQSREVAATRLLITHFRWTMSYPEQHVLGILDAIAELKNRSFLGLKVLGFDFGGDSKHFERHVVRVMKGSSEATKRLYNAVRRGDLAATAALLLKGADASSVTAVGEPLVDFARRLKHRDIAAVLQGIW